MAKTKISEFSSTPANNTDIDSINIAEGCAPSNINDAIRELMAQLKDFQTGAVGDSFNGPIGSSTASTGAFTNITASGTLGVTGVATLGAGAILNTPASVTLTNATGLPISTGVSGLGTGVATALAVNVGSAGAPVVNGGALGTPSSGTVTNLTGTASININGTVGATTPTTGAFTTLAASSSVTLSGGTANGVTYLNGSKVLTSGSALVFDGSNLGVGVTPSAWYSGWKAIENGSGAWVYPNNITYWHLTQNAFLNTSAQWTYKATYAASRYDQNQGQHQWFNAPSGTAGNAITFTQAMTLTTTGLGIGTSSPSFKLDVRQSSDGTIGYFRRIGGTANPALKLVANETGNTVGFDTDYSSSSPDYTWSIGGTSVMRLTSSGNLGLGVTPSAWTIGKAFQVNGASVLSTGTEMYLNANAFYGASAWTYRQTDFATQYYQLNGAHVWRTAPSGTAGNAISFSQAMTLDSSGNLLVGKTSASTTTVGAELRATGNINSASASSTNADQTFLAYSTGASASRFYVDWGGTVHATSTTIAAISDQRLKENIRDLDEGLATVMALKPRKFDWKEGKGQNIKNARGFIAQEFETVLPDMVEEWLDPAPEGEEPYKAINANLIPTLVKAIQELKAEFDAYKASHP